MERADKRKIKNEDTGEEPEEKKTKIKDEIISEDSDNTSQQEKPTRAKRAAKKPVTIQIISDLDGSDDDFNLTSDNSDEDFQPKKARIKKKPKPKVKKEPKQRAPRKPKEQASKKEPKVPKEKAPKKDPKEKVPKEPKAKALEKESTEIKAPVTNTAIKIELVWHEIDRLAEKENLDYRVAKALIKLFESGDTIPFIARYRKALTHNMPPEKLRDVKESYEEICACKRKADNIITVIQKSGHFTPDIKDAILKCKNAEELEYVYAPFKTGPKRTLVQRAKQLGLEESALAILRQTKTVNIDSLINPKREGLKDREAVENGLMHIIAHVITSETETLEFIRKLRSELRMTVESKKITKEVKSESEKKFQNYFDYKISLEHIKPHQTLALNRGENLKILSVKINVPDYALHEFTNFCYQKYSAWGNEERMNLLKNAIEDAYKRKVHPLIVRQTRAELNVKAEKASIEVFALNLKKLLLSTPLKGKTIMGIDPGFKLGCKVAVISPNGDLLDTSVIYPHSAKNQKDHAIIKELLHKYNCSLIALGNGTACRETETWLSDLIKSKYFAPLDVSYTIVDECGASIYSCSAEAKKEFKELDPLLISATSLARRVQDPLAEMVKVDPQHLGVGMYQHDVNKKLLENTLNEIVSECVSFVGVDLNTASQCLLRRVAGLTDLRATNIIKHRMLHGGFTNRWQIKDVKGIGEKVFEQCAGFLRVAPSDSSDAETFFQRPDTNPLDCTWIHPESYELTEKILQKFGLQLNQVGQPSFITSLCKCLVLNSPNSLAKEFDSTKATVKLILDTLRKPFDYDLRNEDNYKPIFRKEVKTPYDICVDMVLTGQVRNVVSFGAFVDIGVGFHGLIHQSAMRGLNVQFGDRVEVGVLKVEIDRRRISLTLLNVL